VGTHYYLIFAKPYLQASRSPHSRLGMMVNDDFSMSQPNTTFPDLDVTFTEADHMLWTDSMKDLTDSSLQDFTEMGIGIGTTPPVSAHSQNPSRNTNTATRFENVELETINEQSLQPSDMSYAWVGQMACHRPPLLLLPSLKSRPPVCSECMLNR
jgi:hypothetical protein